jgi:hypothetical protein
MEKCPKGKILRDGYTYKRKGSKKTIKVKPSCVKDRGKPGKGYKVFEMPEYDKGILSDYGYSLKKNYEDRIKALKKAIKEYGKLKILRRINALRTLHKSEEKYYNKLNRDLKWIQSIE